MKQVRTQYGDHYLKKVGRAKKVYFDDQRGWYFKWNGRKNYGDEIMRLTYPEWYEDENGKHCAIGGYIGINNTYGVLVELRDNETVQLWDEVDR